MISAATDGWVAEACRAKGIELGTPLEGEEMAAGPLATVRYLDLADPLAVGHRTHRLPSACRDKSARPVAAS